MSEPTIISIDAMGGDHGPAVVVPGVARALERMQGRTVRILLHGDQARIQAELDRTPLAAAVSEIRHTDQVIAMDEKPAQALRRGKGSSLWNAIEAVKKGEAHAAVSAGNTGALMAVSKLQLRMAAPGLDRPAIVASWPTLKGVTAVLDVGANVASDAAQLVEFAIMGEAFHKAVHGSKRPTVGLLNVGSEDVKGHEEVREAHRLLRENGFDFEYYGFVEGDDIGKGTVDVVVTDGFTGNIALKTAEGTARFISSLLKEALSSDLQAKLGALIAMPALKRMRSRIDSNEYNGGPLLGLNGIVVKSHGGADARGFGNAIRVATDLAESDYAAEIARNLKRLDAVIHDGRTEAEA
ncbi:phosphate acyltransferase PlsX [Caulobacter sp. 17J80-11]|uniref:phosphate acyltransferase PlsX n=1 Tax=Caulobacter sp. 17J80-11 TaxID=2763502 RepID=UPI001653C54B|nr:phosphate acyltransferase PlsX [Caulobacter sp. 17J80-11]MBC6980837.1 phosphate acyltransferase PlsX [Caulobacter sp. 17J80-11]